MSGNINVDVRNGIFKIGNIELSNKTNIQEFRKTNKFKIFINNTGTFCCELINEVITDGYLFNYLFFDAETGNIKGFLLTPYNPDNIKLVPTLKFISETFGDPQYAELTGYYYKYKWGSISIPFGKQLTETERPIVMTEFN